MSRGARLLGWLPVASLAMAGLLVAACSTSAIATVDISGGDTAAVVSTGPRTLPRNTRFQPSEVTVRSQGDYLQMLSELPLRFDQSNASLHLRSDIPNSQKSAVREVHLLRDSRHADADTLLVIFDDEVIVSVNARKFTVNWQNRLEKRTYYAPVMTARSLFFIEYDGRYHKYDRHSGVLTDINYFGPNFWPASGAVANDSHVMIPTTDSGRLKGVPDSGGSRSSSSSGVTWQFPLPTEEFSATFGQITQRPVADSESIYFVTDRNFLFGINAQNGDFRFRKDLGKRLGTISTPPIVADDQLIVGTDTGVYGFSRSGEMLWSFIPENDRGQQQMVAGRVYAMDGQVFFTTVNANVVRTGGGTFQRLSESVTTQQGGEARVEYTPGVFAAVSIGTITPRVYDSEAERVRGEPDPVKVDANGNPIAGLPVYRSPTSFDWTLKNMDQRVLLKHKDLVFVSIQQHVDGFNDNAKALLRKSGHVVRDDEFNLMTNNILQVLDANTGKVVDRSGQPWSFDVRAFPFIIGSMDRTDRGIYFVTKDGQVFKGTAR